MGDIFLKNTGLAFFRDDFAKRPSFGVFIAIALCMSLMKLSCITANDAATLIMDETFTYLHATHLSFGAFVLYPDCGYINFVPKVAAFLSLRLPFLEVMFPVAFRFLCFFFGALGTLVFLSDRFSCLSPTFSAVRSRQVRFLLCLLFYFFPEHDLFQSYNAAYYMIFPLMWYVLRALDPTPFEWGTCLFIFLTGFAAVWSKPFFFPFGLIILGVTAWWCVIAVRRKRPGPDRLRLASLFWLVILYGVQFLFCLFHPAPLGSGMTELTRLAGSTWTPLFVAGRCVLFLGFGLVAPLYKFLGNLSAPVSALAGLCGLWMIISNARFCVAQRRLGPLLIFIALLGGTVMAVYIILSYPWLTISDFSDSLFWPWHHRHLFIFVLFMDLQALLWAGRRAWKGSFWCVAAPAAVLIVVSFCIVQHSVFGAFHRYALTWSEARELLNERYPFVPVPQLMQVWLNAGEQPLPWMFFSPRLTWGSGLVEVSPMDASPTTHGEQRSAWHHTFKSQGARAVHYLLLIPAKGEDVVLPTGTSLVVEHGGETWRARLINPGKREWYLFAFDRAVPSTYTNSFILQARDGLPPRSAFNVFMAGE